MVMALQTIISRNSPINTNAAVLQGNLSFNP
jgi:hypothetical protein